MTQRVKRLCLISPYSNRNAPRPWAFPRYGPHGIPTQNSPAERQWDGISAGSATSLARDPRSVLSERLAVSANPALTPSALSVESSLTRPFHRDQRASAAATKNGAKAQKRTTNNGGALVAYSTLAAGFTRFLTAVYTWTESSVTYSTFERGSSNDK